jgi:hypothetical protein
MKHTLPLPVLATLGILALCFTAILDAAPPPDQPRMRAALELLQSAKESKNPMPMLTAAKKKLQNAGKNKAGDRVEAIGYVNEAIAQAQTGNLEKMKQKVDAAIANIHQGMGNAK